MILCPMMIILTLSPVLAMNQTRGKRFLTFPSGSSFQLVFCLTYPSVGVGSYFVFGHTAALAWELPTIPTLLHGGENYKNNVEATTTTKVSEMNFPYLHLEGNNKYQTTDSHMLLEVDPLYHWTHRRSRRELYGKITNFLNKLNMDGKSCLLKTICEVSKLGKNKGTFLEEALKGIFRVKLNEQNQNEDEYDWAFDNTHNCTEKYTECNGSLFGFRVNS